MNRPGPYDDGDPMDAAKGCGWATLFVVVVAIIVWIIWLT